MEELFQVVQHLLVEGKDLMDLYLTRYLYYWSKATSNCRKNCNWNFPPLLACTSVIWLKVILKRFFEWTRRQTADMRRVSENLTLQDRQTILSFPILSYPILSYQARQGEGGSRGDKTAARSLSGLLWFAFFLCFFVVVFCLCTLTLHFVFVLCLCTFSLYFFLYFVFCLRWQYFCLHI